MSSNSLYFLTTDGIVMIDTPWNRTQLPNLLDSMRVKHGMQPTLSISTHFHEDRTAGLDYLDSIGVKTYSSFETKQLCIVTGEEQAIHTFIRDTTFVVGGKSISTYFPGPGHAPENIVIHLEDQNILFGGCLVKSYLAKDLGYTGDADVKMWLEGINEVIQRYSKIDLVLPGHGPWKKSKSLRNTRKLVKKAIRFNKRACRKMNVTF